MQEAALELFAERGYAGTTAAEVAERAGLTERTFFRHFPDKREVLFDGEDDLLDRLTAATAAAAEGTAPVEAVAAGLDAVAVEFQGRHETVARRARIVAAHVELRERELMKLASWSDALERVLRGRGLSGRDARLLAEVSVAAFRVAYQRWIDEGPELELVALQRETLAELGGLFGHFHRTS
jgi:AcrR family transcriptional regulator